MRLSKDRVHWVDAWELPVNLPTTGSAIYGDLPTDIQPLQALYDLHWKDQSSTGSWVYRYYYFEVLALEKRLEPAFWVQRNAWGIIRRVCQLSLRGAPSRDVLPQPGRWPSYWAERIREGAIQYEPPEAWLSMLEWDADAAEEYMTFHHGLRWRMIPIYMGQSAEDVKKCMREDLAEVVFSIPRDAGDLMRRWKSWAGRLGLSQRWKTPGEQDLERRKQLIRDLLLDGQYPSDIAQHIVNEGLYPVYPKGHDAGYDDVDKNAETTVYRIVRELTQEGLIAESDINRRPRGRPRKGS